MKSIKIKIISLSLSITIIICILLATIAIIASNNRVNESFENFIKPTASHCAELVSLFIDNKKSQVSILSNSSDVKNSEDDASMYSSITAQLDEIGAGHKNFALISSEGENIKSSSSSAELFTKDEAYKIAIKNSTVIFGGPFSDGENVFYSLNVPIYNENTKKDYVVTIGFDYAELNDIVNEISFSNNSTAYLINGEGSILTNKNIEKTVELENPIKLAKKNKDYKSQGEFLDNTINSSKENDYSFYKMDGDKYVAGYQKLSAYDQYIVIAAPVSDFSKTWSLILITVVGSIVLLVVAFVLINKATSKITKPIIATTERLKSLAEGNLTDPVVIAQTNDEVNVMTTALQDTISTLQVYIAKITEALSNIADGNLTDRVHGAFRGDFIKIKSTFNTILSSLIDTFGNISKASDQVNNGANQVSNGAQALSHGATQQASSIQELSATIYDVSSQVTHNAKSAQDAEQIVADTTESILSCNNDMSSMLIAMDEIHIASNEISKIIKVIDDIAFQTNILALNAAVEAARAGSAGKGFAVVADEVRSLAAKSAEAAKQTTTLIEGSVSTVSRGSKIAKETAEALAQIVEKSKNITTIVTQISEASIHQAESIEQINTGIEQISSVVQTNTATAEQSAAASEELSGQSSLLSGMISKFRIGDKSKIFGNKTSTANVYSNNNDAEFAFGGSSAPAEEFAFGGTSAPADEFAFGGSSEPADEFAFGGSSEPADEFAFGGSSEPTDEFAFGGSSEPADEFAFGGSSEPADEFAFGGSSEPADEFAFGGGNDDAPAEFEFNGDIKIDLDEEDTKY